MKLTEKDKRASAFVRKGKQRKNGKTFTMVTDRPESMKVMAQQGHIINHLNHICPSCKGFVIGKTARRRYREMYRATGVVHLGDLDGNTSNGDFNGKCACGAYLIVETGQEK